jgi:hypothetical protein
MLALEYYHPFTKEMLQECEDRESGYLWQSLSNMVQHDNKLDVLALNETRLDSSISDDLMSIEGYDILRSDRKRNGGGKVINSFISMTINLQYC